MAQSSTMNPAMGTAEQAGVGGTEQQDVKTEVEVTIKEEAVECAVCGTRSRDSVDMECARTPSGRALHAYLAQYTGGELAAGAGSRHVCGACFRLISVLERAELEYMKLKEAFEAVLSKSPLLEGCAGTGAGGVPALIELTAVKRELDDPPTDRDSEDEPLARRRTHRPTKTVKKKKKLTSGKMKRKKTVENSRWECEECGVQGDSGGPVELAAHKLSVHVHIPPVKIEDGSQSPFNNEMDDTLEISFDSRFEFDDDDDEFIPEELANGGEKKKARRKPMERKEPKVMHPCDQCNARYSSLARLEAHKSKHDGSKPPYICEVCGAHYKHKRACDIHIALHKGISDWKCEECNKLFPSKNALQRHNNIHTGKLNYQCDLCGKSFIHTSSFKMHKLSHTGVKPHACDVCGLALMTRSHLKRHKRIHSGEKRHECKACGKRFSERYNLAAHQKSHELPPPSSPPASTPAAAADRRRHFFRCHFCTERFERRYMLERHMSAVHGRTLERPPPTPRNTMSKLLKQRAQRPAPPAPAPLAPAPPAPAPPAPCKDEGGAGDVVPTSAPLCSSKLLAQLSASTSIITTGSWSGAYAAEFGLRHDYPH